MTQADRGTEPEWAARFLAALRQTSRPCDAIAAAGVSPSTAYRYRLRNAAFDKAWKACLSQEDTGRRPRGAAKIDRFLEALAETSNVTAAAETAGVQLGSIYRMRRDDPEFARRWYAALAEGYDNLEMELLGRLRSGESEGSGAAKAKFDTATALRCLSAHRESVAREKGRRTLADEVATIASINAKIDSLRLARARGNKAIAAARKAKAQANMVEPGSVD